MNILLRRQFWLNLAGASIAAIAAAAPVMMSNVMDRGFEIAKQCVAEPLAVLAFGAVLLAGGWRSIMSRGRATRMASGALAAFILLAVVSTVLSGNPEVAIFGGYYRREGLLAWSVYAAFFFALLCWAHRADRLETFLDVLLLSSIIPAIYALQQRLEFDFYARVAGDFARPGSTMGNPLFLAAYFGLLLPITVARCWAARRATPEFILWVTVLVLQSCVMIIAQSRGPWLAAMLGMVMFVCCWAGRAGARATIAMALGAFACAALLLVAINTQPTARQWAQETPLVSRLVFNLQRDASLATRNASLSAATRLAIWGAGADTFAAAPLSSKLLGYGPESAFQHYFAHMPVSAIRLAGYGANTTFDRLHADTLDVGLNYGVLAWSLYCLFFSVVMYAAARTLWGLTGRGPPLVFFALSCAGGGIAAAAAVGAGLAMAAVPAFGLGIGAGWFLFMVGCAWRASGGVTPHAVNQIERWMLLAAFASALWFFWMDAQVNIPVLITRLISLGIAALILIVADGIGDASEKYENTESVPRNNLRVWCIAFSLIAAIASCLPVVLFDGNAGSPDIHWGRRIFLILPFVLVMAFATWARARRGTPADLRSWAAIALGTPLIYAAVHRMLMVMPDSVLKLEDAQLIATLSFAGPLSILLMCIAYAVVTRPRHANTSDVAPLSGATCGLTAAVATAVLLVVFADWRAARADIASKLAERAFETQPQVSELLVEESVRLLPYERHYRRQLAFDLLGHALADIRAQGAAPENMSGALRNLGRAETVARKAALYFPQDPWVVGALANVLQVKALRVLRPLDPAGGARAAQEAAQLFAHAHEMFPNEPLILRNWAQLLFDQGELAASYQVLDRMEALIPGNAEPYFERLGIAKQVNDSIVISETLARAHLALEPPVFSQLLTDAKLQQN